MWLLDCPGGGRLYRMGNIEFTHLYDDIISVENLLKAWANFIKGKRKKKDVQAFQYCLLDNIIELHNDLKNKTYVHGSYYAFNVSDPKPRNIHKATVRDRLLHHAIYRVLYPYFDKKFVSDSYSCRVNKGTHKAIEKFHLFSKQSSSADTKTVWVLKCDIRKFFASVDHATLVKIFQKHVTDNGVVWLISNIVKSFNSTKLGVGLPLGNLTSQLLVNIYMNEFDQFMKHEAKAKYYIRYADDFVIFNRDKIVLLEMIQKITEFLETELKLSLHPNKVCIKTMASGVDFLGWMHFPTYQVLRTTTKKRMFKRLGGISVKPEVIQSYFGLLGNGNTFGLKMQIRILCEERAIFRDSRTPTGGV